MSAGNTITGLVIQASDKAPIKNANIIIIKSDSKIVAYGISANDGSFSIKLPSTTEKLSIKVSMLGYKTYLSELSLDSKDIVISLQDEAVQLKEVIVKAERIKEEGDTITYRVGSFAQKQDKSIGDVLKRMPGIDVAKNGKIQYQGVDINKFYIEGNDLLEGKYGVATNGISHNDIGSVEILENHQPMQVLRGLSFSDQAAINLKMKNSAKASFLYNATLSGGISEQPKGLIGLGNIFTMMLTKNYQMITTLKGNNSGENLEEQFINFTKEVKDENIDRYISLSTPVSPNIQSNRSYFNNSWMISSSHLIKTVQGDDIKAQVDYSQDRISAESINSTTYFIESGDKTIFEYKKSLYHRNALSGKFTYEANRKTYFLNNTLSTDLSWNDLRLNTMGSLVNNQSYWMPEYSLSNNLKIIKRFNNNKLITFISHNEWNSLPEKLIVNQNNKTYGQEIKQQSFYTNEQASMGFVFNNTLLSLNTGISGYFRQLNTNMFGIDRQNLLNSDVITTNYLRAFASPKLEWRYRMLVFTFELPLNVYSYFFSGSIANRTEVFISPYMRITYRITPKMSLGLSFNANNRPALLQNIYDSSILRDYRTFSTGIDDYYTRSGQSLALSYNYKNIPIGMFIMMMGRYAWNQSKFRSIQNIIDNYIFHSYKAEASNSRNAIAFIQIGKTLDVIRGTMGLKVDYQRMENNLISQGKPTNYYNDHISISPFINGNISKYFNWNLRFMWDKSLLKLSNMPRRSSDNFIYSGNLTFTPLSLITWTIGGEFYHNQIEEGRYKDMFMLDTKLTFNISKRFEISLSATNLLNNKEYRYTSYNTISQYEHSSLLRGREFMLSIYIKK